MAKILLADDDRATLDLLRRALELDGHAVVTAEDGNLALAELQSRGPFDVLVTDVQMPGLDGVGLATTALASLPDLRIVMVSAHHDSLDGARTVPARHLRLLPKPFTIDAIRGEIRSVLAA